MEDAAYFIRLTDDEIRQFWENHNATIVITRDDVDRAVSLVQSPLVVVVEDTLRELALRMVDLINRDRLANPVESRNARPLQWDERVAQVALQHSEDMLRRRFIAHINPDGETPFDRIRKAGIRFRCAGENLASGYHSIEATQYAFMDEPPYAQNHRGNILNPSFTHVGIGIAMNPDGTYVVTQNFIGRA